MEIEITCAALPEILIPDRDKISVSIGDSSGNVYPIYRNQTVVIPTEEDQVLSTKNKVVSDDIIVKAIPSNYGRVSYNGSTLRIE